MQSKFSHWLDFQKDRFEKFEIGDVKTIQIQLWLLLLGKNFKLNL